MRKDYRKEVYGDYDSKKSESSSFWDKKSKPTRDED
jgi:hypothetical protein